ncbi:AraC family transcriptional regulator [Paenibacillus sp. DMB20]|uniref:AraC family transcriptional regulator n=1 Tax=Paenibacillus sp. DMB20 TaxID=1642570 RepID=UPI0006274C71|nr:AraC family transcriptional regulator [Paenibacillus sp. DMB20]KKO50962.1 Fe3+-hydroxamate ABC transporter substrate-binding protein [Paenibacillus sp. DMB20]
MTDHSLPLAPLHSLLFYMKDIELTVQPVGWKSDTFTTDAHTLLVIANGTGCMHVNDSEFYYTAEKGYLFSPGQAFRIDNGYDHAIRFYLITFSVIQAGNHPPKNYNGYLLPERIELTAYPISRLIRITEELYHRSTLSDPLEACKLQLDFHELIHFVIEHNCHSEQPTHPIQAVERTIQYIENHYTENITVKELAKSAQVPYWQYTPIFQELTGKRPLDYVTELRINRSKQLLIQSDDPLREIARRVGFSDEYYFNRRFRQTTGIAPKQYARLMRNNKKIRDWTGHIVDIPARPERIIYYGETFGDLFALGVDPIGGGTIPPHLGEFQERLKHVTDIGHPVEPEILAELRPDLIIFSNPDERKYNQIAKIAPTVTFNSFAPLEQRLYTLGDMLGRRREAEKWLKRYNAKAAIAWQRMSPSICLGETASVFTYEHGRRLFVMGSAGLSSGLYHPNGFLPVTEVQKLLHDGQGFAEIEEASLPAYAGDRIFMLLPENGESRFAMEELMNSSLWHSLPAVRKGQVYLLEAAQWNYADAITRELLLEALPKLLGRTF